MTPAVELVGVTKDFPLDLPGRRVRALDRVSIAVASGEVHALVGENGSGKSTILKIIAGLVRPTAGSCYVFGAPAGSEAARNRMGFVPDAADFHGSLTGREWVGFHASLSGFSGSLKRRRVDEVIDRVGLSSAADRRVSTYSKGMLRRIGLAQAIVHEPDLLLLDEPTAGVDADGVQEILATVLALSHGGRTIVVTSHIASEIDAVADAITILGSDREQRFQVHA
jgi:ABC-2 type transport system ATP-binding protein